MPPKESIERVRRWQIAAGVFATLMMCATSGTKYISDTGFLFVLPAVFAMLYVNNAIKSFSRYVRTSFPNFYHHEELNTTRRYLIGGRLVQIWPYKSLFGDMNDQGKCIRQKVLDLIPDRDYIQSLEALQRYYRTAIAVVALDFGALILFSILRLWA